MIIERRNVYMRPLLPTGIINFWSIIKTSEQLVGEHKWKSFNYVCIRFTLSLFLFLISSNMVLNEQTIYECAHVMEHNRFLREFLFHFLLQLCSSSMTSRLNISRLSDHLLSNTCSYLVSISRTFNDRLMWVWRQMNLKNLIGSSSRHVGRKFCDFFLTRIHLNVIKTRLASTIRQSSTFIVGS